MIIGLTSWGRFCWTGCPGVAPRSGTRRFSAISCNIQYYATLIQLIYRETLYRTAAHWAAIVAVLDPVFDAGCVIIMATIAFELRDDVRRLVLLEAYRALGAVPKIKFTKRYSANILEDTLYLVFVQHGADRILLRLLSLRSEE